MSSVLVFDMGGVLFDFQGDRLLRRTSRRRFRRNEAPDSWLPLLRRFETGACSSQEFAEGAVQIADLALSPAQFLDAFQAAAVGFYAGALNLLRELGGRHRLLSLSNTNALQWPRVLTELGHDDPFQAHFPSHLSGFHKPDPRAFRALESAHGIQGCFFFDDRPGNVAAANECGWRARRVRGVQQARSACLELGLLDA